MTADGWHTFADVVRSCAPAVRERVEPEDRLVDDLGFDSLLLAELVLALDDTYQSGIGGNLAALDWTDMSAGRLYRACIEPRESPVEHGQPRDIPAHK